MKRVALLLCLSPCAFAQDIDLPHTLSNNAVADADQVMGNFNALKDGVNSRVSVDLTNRNVVIGDGMQSVSIGPLPLNGQDNTASGWGALYSNTTGYGNTANGSAALYNATTGWGNTANGSAALYNTTSGSGNTASGFAALYYNTEGHSNTVSGFQALGQNTTGHDNTSIGFFALFRNTTGFSNTAIGYKSLYDNSGDQNTASGWQALYRNTTGSGNTASGFGALSDNTTGIDNTAIGKMALSLNTTGNENTAVGHYAHVTADNLNNATAIGANARVDASNKIQLGNTDVTSVATAGKLTTGDVTYPNEGGLEGQILALTDDSGTAGWIDVNRPQLTSGTCGGQNTCELSCTADKVATGGGCSGQSGLRETRPTANLAGWYCRDETVVDSIYVICR